MRYPFLSRISLLRAAEPQQHIDVLSRDSTRQQGRKTSLERPSWKQSNPSDRAHHRRQVPPSPYALRNPIASLPRTRTIAPLQTRTHPTLPTRATSPHPKNSLPLRLLLSRRPRPPFVPVASWAAISFVSTTCHDQISTNQIQIHVARLITIIGIVASFYPVRLHHWPYG